MSAINIAKDTIQVVATRILQLVVAGVPGLTIDAATGSATAHGNVDIEGDLAADNAEFTGDVSAGNAEFTGNVAAATAELTGNFKLALDSVQLFGEAGVVGSWRITRSTNDLVFQRLETVGEEDVWVTKSTIAAA